MDKSETGELNDKKLVKNEDLLSLDNLPIKPYPKKLTNKKKPVARIREHKVKGRIYYTYYQPGEKEIYLGSADKILEAVKG